MRSQTKNQVAHLSALTLLFSYIESILPRTVPFFRLGLGNIALLMSFSLPPMPFMALCTVKAAASSMMAGTLFSPFFPVSLAQSIASGFFMYAVSRLNARLGGKLLSLYGISVLGSAISAVVQIICCSLYLGRGTFTLLGAMLIFNTASGIITAFFCGKIGNPSIKKSGTICAHLAATDGSSGRWRKKRHAQMVLAVALLLSAASVFFVRSIPVLVLALCLSLAAQKRCGRRILVLPHLSLWVFVIAAALLVPEGKVIMKIGSIAVTQGALVSGIQKSLRLSAASALSQCAVVLRPPKDSLLALSLLYYRALSDTFRTSEGGIFRRIQKTLGTESDDGGTNHPATETL